MSKGKYQYVDGRRMAVGDTANIPGVGHGKIVAIIDEQEFSDRYPKSDWAYLERGILLEIIGMGLTYYEVDFNEQWTLVARDCE